VIIAELVKRGAAIRAYDPVAMPEARRVLADLPKLSLVDHQSEALDGADALLVVTEWKEFRTPDFEAIRDKLKQPVVFDGRNIWEPDFARSFGLEYRGIGRHTSAKT